MEDLEITNKSIMFESKQVFKENKGLAIRGNLLYGIIHILIFIFSVKISLFSSSSLYILIGFICILIVSNAIDIGTAIFYLSLSRREKTRATQIFKGFPFLWVALWTDIFASFFIYLWSLLFVIPGLIARFSYVMTPYIIAENSKIGPLEAISKSKQIMQGNKWKFLCLKFRFLAWDLIGICSLGIGYLWISPYKHLACAKFYNNIKNNIRPEEYVEY